MISARASHPFERLLPCASEGDNLVHLVGRVTECRGEGVEIDEEPEKGREEALSPGCFDCSSGPSTSWSEQSPAVR